MLRLNSGSVIILKIVCGNKNYNWFPTSTISVNYFGLTLFSKSTTKAFKSFEKFWMLGNYAKWDMLNLNKSNKLYATTERQTFTTKVYYLWLLKIKNSFRCGLRFPHIILSNLRKVKGKTEFTPQQIVFIISTTLF